MRHVWHWRRGGPWLVVLALWLFASPSGAQATPPVRNTVVLDAAFDKAQKHLRGTAQWTITNDTGTTLHQLPFWLYPNRLAHPGAGLADCEAPWIYPQGNSRGRMDITDFDNGEQRDTPSPGLRYDAMPVPGTPRNAERMIVYVPLADPLAPGAQAEITLHFTTEIPVRRARFGRFRGAVTLADGWYPRPLTDLTGRATALPPAPIDAQVSVRLPPKTAGLLVDIIHEAQANPQTLAAQFTDIDELLLATSSRGHRHTETTAGIRWAFFSATHLPREPNPDEPAPETTRRAPDVASPSHGVRNIGRTDRLTRIRTTLHSAVDALRDLAPTLPLPRSLTIVEAPLRDRLVQRSGDVLLVSDHLYQLAPFEPLLRRHDAALATELLTALVYPALRRTESPVDAALFAEVIADVALRQHLKKSQQPIHSLQRTLGFAAFVPFVDSLLYAPQIPFEGTYSHQREVPDPLRDAVNRFMNTLPNGRRIAAKYEDILGDEAVVNGLGLCLAAKVSCAETLDGALGDFRKTFRAQWFGPHPVVAYRIAETAQTPQPNEGFLHRITVERLGDDIAEPVTVRLIDKTGAQTELQWAGEGQRGTVTWISPGPLRRAVLDPNERLHETPSLTSGHPRADNDTALPLRPPLLTRLLLWFDSVALDPTIDVAFALRRKYDIAQAWHLSATYSPRTIGGNLSYLRYFGAKSTLNDKTAWAGPELSLRYHRPVDAGDIGALHPSPGAWVTTWGVAAGTNTRQYFFDPQKGRAIHAWLGWGAGRFDDGQRVLYGQTSLRFARVISPAIGHTLAATAGIDALTGTVPHASLITLSHRAALRGFDVHEIYGRAAAFAVLEYRHTLLSRTAISMPLRTRLDRLQGVAFAAAGTASHPTDYAGLFASDRIFAEAGYGLRLHWLLFGALPYLMAVDVAVPFWPHDRSFVVATENGDKRHHRAPVRWVFGVTQAF